MRGPLSQPVAKIALNMAVTNVTTSAWAELEDSLPEPCSAIEVFNPSAAVIMIGVGAAASEVEQAYYVLPGGSAIILPMGFAKGSRIALKSLDQTANDGYFVMNFFA